MDRASLQRLLGLALTRNTSNCEPVLVMQYINLADSFPIIDRLKRKSGNPLDKRPKISNSDQKELKANAAKTLVTRSVSDFRKISNATHEEIATMLRASMISKYGSKEDKRAFALENNAMALAIAAWDPLKVRQTLQDVDIKELRQTAKTIRAAVGKHKWFANLESRDAIIDSLVLIVVRLKADLSRALKDVKKVNVAIEEVGKHAGEVDITVFASMLEDKYITSRTALMAGGGFWGRIGVVKICLYCLMFTALELAALSVHWLFWVPFVLWNIFGIFAMGYYQVRFNEEDAERQRQRMSDVAAGLRNSEDKFRRQLGLKEIYDRSDVSKAFRQRSLRAHPDRGGTEEKMKALNEAKDGLIHLLDNEESPSH